MLSLARSPSQTNCRARAKILQQRSAAQMACPVSAGLVFDSSVPIFGISAFWRPRIAVLPSRVPLRYSAAVLLRRGSDAPIQHAYTSTCQHCRPQISPSQGARLLAMPLLRIETRGMPWTPNPLRRSQAESSHVVMQHFSIRWVVKADALPGQNLGCRKLCREGRDGATTSNEGHEQRSARISANTR
jgi:hypothetical protein